MSERLTAADAVGIVEIDYTNHEGKRSLRRINPWYIVYGANQWHKEEQWLLQARDVDKDATRTFAMKDIHSWTPLNGVPHG